MGDHAEGKRVGKSRADDRQYAGGPPAPGAPNSPQRSWVPPGATCGDGGYLAAFDTDFKRLYPILWDFLALTGVAGANRRTGTILVFCEDGMVKGCLTDREEGFYSFLSAKSFTELLEAFNKALEKGGLEWRRSKYPDRGRK